MVQLPITGGAYKHESQDTNNQRCVNWFPTSPGPEGRGKSTLVPSAGIATAYDFNSAAIRGMKTVFDNYYLVMDNGFFKMTTNPVTLETTAELLGTLDSITGNVSIEYNQFQIIIVDGTEKGYIYDFQTIGKVYNVVVGGNPGDTYTLIINGVTIYNNANVAAGLDEGDIVTQINLFTGLTGVTATEVQYGTGSPEPGIQLQSIDSSDIVISESGTGFTAGTDGITKTGGNFSTGTRTPFHEIDGYQSAFPGGVTVVFLDQYFVVNKPDSAEMYASSLYEGNEWSGADVATAESKPDNLVALAVHKGELWAFGQSTIEIWTNVANPTGFPFSRLDGSGMDIGLMAPFSVSVVDNVLMWLDHRGYVCQSADANFIRNNNSSYTINIVSTPALHAEFATYPDKQDAVAFQWNDRGHLFYQITFIAGDKTWVFDYQLNQWHERTYYNSVTNNEQAFLIQYVAVLNGVVHCAGKYSSKVYVMDRSRFKTDDGSLIRCRRITAPFFNEFKRISVDRLEIRMETGQMGVDLSNDPQIRLRYSQDGGHTWGSWMARSLKTYGNYSTRIAWNRLGTLKEWVLEFAIAEEVDFSLIDAAADLTMEA